MIKDILEKYNIGPRYSYEIYHYLSRFDNDPYLMDVNADVLSRLNLDNINIIFVDEPIGEYGISSPHMANNVMILPTTFTQTSGKVVDINDENCYREVLVDELIKQINKLMSDNKTNTLGMNRLVSGIGVIKDPLNLKTGLIPFSVVNKSIDYITLLKSEISVDRTILRNYVIKTILEDDESNVC